MTASSPQRRIKQKFQAGHTENESGQGDLTDSSITHSLPYSITECGYVIPWPSFPQLRSPVLLTHIPKHPHMCTNTHASQLVFINKTFLEHLRNNCWASLNIHQVFQGWTGIVSVIKRSCMQTLDSEPRRGSITNVCVFTLPGSSSTKPHHLPGLH